MKSEAKFEYEICLFHQVQHLILNIAEHELCMDATSCAWMPHSQPQSGLQGNQACSRLPSRVFFVTNFRHLATKTKGLANLTKGILRI
jgi:hypothetical protein